MVNLGYQHDRIWNDQGDRVGIGLTKKGQVS